MKVMITDLQLCDIPDTVELTIRFGDIEEKKYKANHIERDGINGGDIETELFFRLSELGIQNLCNSAYYHVEVARIVERFLKKEYLPKLPIDISRSQIGLKRPSTFKIIKGRIWRLSQGLNPFGDGDPLRQHIQSELDNA